MNNEGDSMTKEIRIRKNGSKFEVCEYTKSIKGINPWYCSRILLTDCETIEEAEGAKNYCMTGEIG
jgi:hypothetical protein